MTFTTKIARASSIADSYRTTVPAAIMKHFELGVGDVLSWELWAEDGEIKIMITPTKANKQR